jgi:hypothetical protein
MQQYNIVTYATMNTERDFFYGHGIVVYGLLLICGVSSCLEIAREGPDFARTSLVLDLVCGWTNNVLIMKASCTEGWYGSGGAC